MIILEGQKEICVGQVKGHEKRSNIVSFVNESGADWSGNRRMGIINEQYLEELMLQISSIAQLLNTKYCP